MGEKLRIVEFDGRPSSWREWKAKIRAQMKLHGVWEAVTEEQRDLPSANLAQMSWSDAQKEAVKRNDKAYNMLLLSCQGSAFYAVERATSEVLPEGDAKEAWKNLVMKYEDSEMPDVLMLRQQLTTRVLKEGEETDMWIDDLEYLQRRLQDAGAVASDSELVHHVMLTAPRRFSELITSLEIVPDLTLDMVRKRFRAFQKRVEMLPNNEDTLDEQKATGQGAMAVGGFKGRCYKCGQYGHQAKQCKLPGSKCFKCGKIGHLARECRNKTSAGQTGSASIGQMMSAFTSSPAKANQEVWLLDSGATCHMTPFKELFVDLNEHSCGQVTVGDGSQLKVAGVGSIDVVADGRVIQLKNVHWVPGICRNLLSMTVIAQKLSISINRHRVTVMFDHGKPLHIPYHAQELGYVWKAKCSGKTKWKKQAYAAAEKMIVNKKKKEHTVSYQDFHCAVGHPSETVTKKWATQLGVHLNGVTDCTTCAAVKAKKKSVSKVTSTRSDKAGERVFVDTAGPFQFKSWGGSRYMVMVVDDFSRKKWVRFIKTKDELGSAVEPILKSLPDLKFIRCDNAGENITHKKESLRTLANKLQAKLELTSADTPQQNGVAERAIALTVEKGTALLEHAGFPQAVRNRMWAEAAYAAVRLLNETPTLSNEDMQTPSEMFGDTRRIPVKHMRIFGEEGYRVDSVKVKKFRNKGKKVFFVGYSEEHSTDTYRVFNPDTKHISVTRNVTWVKRNPLRVCPKHTADAQVSNDEQEEDDSILDKVDIISISSSTDTDLDGKGEEVPQGEDTAAHDTQEEDTEQTVSRAAPRPKQKPAQRMIPTRSSASRTRSGKLLAATAALNAVGGEPDTYQDAMSCDNREDWIGAIKKELDSFDRKQVWKPIACVPAHKKALDTKWVFKHKDSIPGVRDEVYKARLVVKGFQQVPGVDFTETYSPVARDTTIRMFLAAAVHQQWKIEQIDIETAFLNAPLEEDIYVKAPSGYNGSDFLKLNKAVYGLLQAPRQWMKSLASALSSISMIQSKADPCLFVKMDGAHVKLAALVYVDDILISGPDVTDIELMIELIGRKYSCTRLGQVTEYLGLQIHRDDKQRTMTICQRKMVQKIVQSHSNLIKPEKMPAPGGQVLEREEDGKLCDEKRYRSLVGKLLYLSKMTRPDITTAVRELSQYLSKPEDKHWQAALRVVGYLSATVDTALHFDGTGDMILEAHVDSAYAPYRSDRKSITGMIVRLGQCPVAWQSKKQGVVSLSSTEAEYIAMAHATAEVMHLRSVLQDLTGNSGHMAPTVIHEDNMGAIFIATNHVLGPRTKHIDVRYHFVKDAIEDGHVEVSFVRSKSNRADGMTKNLPLTEYKLGQVYWLGQRE